MNPEHEQEIRKLHEEAWDEMEATRKELEGYLVQLSARLSRGSFRPRLVEARVKSVASVLRKMDEESATPDQLHATVRDMIGARVVVYNLSDAEAFQTALLEDEHSELSRPVAVPVEYPSGYRAIHVNAYLADFGCEVQIRTAIQDAWAVTSRADMYRREALPLASTLSTAQSNVLKGVDDVLQAIRDLFDNSRPEEGTEATPEPEEETAEEPPTEPPELDDAAMREAKDSLEPDEKLVLDASISEYRVDELMDGLEGARESSTVKRLFRAVGGYERVREYHAHTRYGQRSTIFKGPFVEGSNWVSYRPSDFTDSLESFLLWRLGHLLSEIGSPSSQLESSEATTSYVASAIERVQEAGGQADLIAVQGLLSADQHELLMGSSDWTTTPQIRGTSLASTPHVNEVIAGLPVLRIYDERLQPAIHVFDLSSLRYRQTNPDGTNDANLFLRVQEVDFERATELLRLVPEFAQTTYRSQHGEDGTFTREQTVVHLKLRVELHIVEAGEIVPGAEGGRVESALLGAT